MSTNILVTLIYADNTRWFAGAFPTLDAATAWIDMEKTRPYWKSDTEIQIT